MSNGIGNRTESMCDLYRRGIPVGSIAAQFDVQRPAVWKALRRGGVLPDYKPRKPMGPGRPVGGGEPGYQENRRSRALAKIERRDEAAPAPVNREPCHRCGARGDIGCLHSWSRAEDAHFADAIADGATIEEAARALGKSAADGERHFALICYSLGAQAA